MKFSLSTNWCNRRLDDGAAIAEKALALGFEELELGYNTTPEQVAGFMKMRDRIPVGSVHAFCPVPLPALRASQDVARLDPAPTHHAPGVQHQHVRAYGRGELDVAAHL